jgi:serine/threonine protein kinase
MNSASSSFDESQEKSPLLNTFSEIIPFEKRGATSDCFKVRIYGKWHFLKRPKKEFKNHPLYIAAFEKEFDLGFTLDHPNIVRYLNKGNDSEGIYILTEYVDGLTLNDFRGKHPHYFQKEENNRKILSQLVSALAYLHSHQIVHLDIKPENILITNNGNNVKLIDLGLSYSDCYTEITGGTHTFGSPEQFGHSEQIDERSDMYAVGKVMLYLFTGQVDIHSVRKLPNGLRELAKRCLQEDIQQRTITANEFLSVLSRKRANYTLVVVVVLFIALIIGIIEWRKPKIVPAEPKTIKRDTIVIKQVIPQKDTKQKEQKANKSTELIESEIRKVIHKRLTPNVPTMVKIYSDINEYNYSVLKQSFSDWKNSCMTDCKILYDDYKDNISYTDFEAIYAEELNKIDRPIQEKLDNFKR